LCSFEPEEWRELVITGPAYRSALQRTFSILHILRGQKEGVACGQWQAKELSINKMSINS